MLDYNSIWIKFAVFFETGKHRQIILDSLHEETKKGFDVLTKIASEELENKLERGHFDALKEDLEMLLAFSVFQGYILFLISHNIDPEKSKLFQNKQTSKLGDMWMEQYEKDQGKSLLLEIDPILSLFLEKAKQSRMNQLLTNHPKIAENTYKEIAAIDNFFNWLSHQGYILGLLEAKLNSS